jgi:hypothetical protein
MRNEKKRVLKICSSNFRYLNMLNIDRFVYAPIFSGTVRQYGFITLMVSFPRNTTLPVQVSKCKPIVKILS